MRGMIAMALLLGGASAVAAEPSPTKPPEKDSRVCRDSATTGTRIRSSECHRKSEWVEIDAARHKQYEEFNRRLNSGIGEQLPLTAPGDH